MSRLKSLVFPAAGLAGAAFFCALCEPWRPVVRRFDCILPNLPEEAQGLRIAHLSDIHVSAIQPLSYLRRVVALTNAQNADLIALTGDFISRRNSYNRFTFARYWAKDESHYVALAARELGLLRARLGVFATPGNHDYGNWDFEPVGAALASAGIEILNNGAAVLPGGLPLVGLADLRAGRPDYRAVFTGIAAERAQLILSHNPRTVWQLAAKNALILCGHIHGGQVKLPGRLRRQPNDAGGNFWRMGFYRFGRAQISVSAGIGNVGVPMRLGVPPEITIWTLKRA